jgi:AGZA family xanthine/uracil permease-like MFS transporter
MGFIDEEGDFPRSRQAFAADALATLFGSFFGLSPVTSFVESAAGVQAGARTGLTAVICGFFFFLSIFFAPIIASIPPWATGGSLIIVGSLMARSLVKVKWYDVSHAATAFITVMVMPLTYSIAYGLIAGIMTWIILQSTFNLLSLVGIEKPVFDDPDAYIPTTEIETKVGEVADEIDGELESSEEDSDKTKIEAQEEMVVEMDA